jgi:hypothetical protein
VHTPCDVIDEYGVACRQRTGKSIVDNIQQLWEFEVTSYCELRKNILTQRLKHDYLLHIVLNIENMVAFI